MRANTCSFFVMVRRLPLALALAALYMSLSLSAAENDWQQAFDLYDAAVERPAGPPVEAPWSKAVGGLQARIVLKRREVFGGTQIISPFLELRNVSNVMNPMKVAWTRQSMKFRVLDAQGHQLKEGPSAHSGPVVEKLDLLLPVNSTLSFDISMGGLGVSGDEAGQLETWVFDRDDKNYYLHAVLEIPEGKRGKDEFAVPWDGRIEMPRVLVPLKPMKLIPAKVGPLIETLGARMLTANSDVSDEAIRALSLIDDPRVIPWYLKAMDTDRYELKYAALDRLARFNSDAALDGIKKAMRRTNEKDNDTFRHLAAESLLRSPHPGAMKLLLTMWDDPYREVRVQVVEALGKMKSDESFELLKKMSHDPDEGVRNQAIDCLESRTKKLETRRQ